MQRRDTQERKKKVLEELRKRTKRKMRMKEDGKQGGNDDRRKKKESKVRKENRIFLTETLYCFSASLISCVEHYKGADEVRDMNYFKIQYLP